MQPLALHGHMKPVTMVRFNSDGDLVFAAAKEDKITMWDTAKGELRGIFRGHKSANGLDVNFCSTMLATAGHDFVAKIWSVDNGQCLAVLEHASPCLATGFAHDDSLLFTVSGGKMGVKANVALYKIPDNILTRDSVPLNATIKKLEIDKGTDTDTAITFAQWGPTNDTIYFCQADGSVSIMDVERMEVVQKAEVHKEECRKIKFDFNYHMLVSASRDKTSRLLDSRNLKVVQTYEMDNPVNDAAISPLGDHVIIGGGTEAQDVTTTGGQGKFDVKFHHKVQGQQLGSMKCHFGTINTLAFHPSGRSFASGAVDGFVKLHSFDESYYSAPGSKPIWTPPAATDE